MSLAISRRAWLAGTLAAVAAIEAQDRPENVNDEIRQLAERAPLAMQFNGTTSEECRQWQERFGAKLRDLFGPFEPPSARGTSVEETVRKVTQNPKMRQPES